MIPHETVSLVRERIDIVDVIGEYVELRRAGANYKGLCPFHQEKTPSFNVNSTRQIFHCFGCGVGGDAITFLMNYEGRTFTDAVRVLAERANVQIEEHKESPERRSARRRQRSEKERLTVVAEAAAYFYRDLLASKAGQLAMEYLTERGIDQSMIDSFSLGYAPSEWDALAQSLKKLKVTPSEAEKVGLIVPRRSGGGHYDRFRDRVIFPVHDAAGRIVALGGRVLPGAPKDAPKYVNSPESEIFSKSRMLYGLYHAREAFRRKEQPLLVEGNLDVISLHAKGFIHAVAPMGTALTVEQVGLLRRFAGRESTVTILFDGDEAGQQAAKRAHSALAEGGLGARVAQLPPSEDPDSYLRREGIAALQKIIDGSEGLVEHLIAEAAREAGSDAHSKTKGIRALAPIIAAVTDPMEQDLYRRSVARAFGVAEDVVFRYLRSRDTGDGEEKREERPEARRKIEGAIVGALLDHPELIEEAVRAELLNLVTEKKVRWILERLREVAAGEREMGSLVEEAPDSGLAKRLRARLVSPKSEDIEVSRQEMLEALAKLRGMMEREQGEQLQSQINEANEAGDETRGLQLAQEKLLKKKQAAGLAPDGTSGR